MLKVIFLAGLVAGVALSSNDRWSLERLVARAVEQAPILLAYQKDVEKAHLAAKQAGRWSNPDLTFSMGPMSQAGVSGHSLDLSLKQNIPLFGQKSLAEKLGRQHETMTQIDVTRETLALKHRVVLAAYKYLVSNELYQHVEHRKKKIELILKFLNSRPFVSPIQSVERDLIRYRIREVEENFLDISLAKESAWQALNVYLGLEKPVQLDIQWKSEVAPVNRESFQNLLLQQNLELKQLESMIAASGLEMELAAKKKLPEIRLGAIYNEQTADLPQRVFMGNLELSLPILDQGGYGYRSTAAAKEALVLRMRQKKRELESRFEQSWISLENALGKLKLYPISLLGELDAQLALGEQHWKRNLISAAVFLEMENQVHKQTDKIYEMQYGYIEALGELEMLVGQEFSLEGAGDA